MKPTMKKNISVLILSLLILSFGNAYGQDFYKSCVIKNVSVIKSSETQNIDTVLLTYIETETDLKLTIHNFKKDTMYLFCTYFDDKFYASPSLHRHSKTDKIYRVSFLPFLPNLVLKKPDLVKTNSGDRVLDNQNIYSFIIIPPNFNYTLNFPLSYLFPNNLTADFDLKNVTLSNKKLFEFGKKQKKLTLSKIVLEQQLFFEFAYYSNIDFICETSNMYLKTNDFRIRALGFSTVTTQISLQKYRHRLLKQE